MKLHQYLGTAVLILSLTSAHAGQAIFKYTEHLNSIGNGSTAKDASKGFLVLDPDSPRTNLHMTLITGLTLTNGQKFFVVDSTLGYSLVRVFGSKGDAHTIIARGVAPDLQLGVVSASNYYIGRELPVTIDGKGKRNLPLKLTIAGHTITSSPSVGLTLMTTTTGTAVLDLNGSRASNAANESFDDTVTKLAAKMVALGYTRFTVPASQ